jgi:hypothetical protein
MSPQEFLFGKKEWHTFTTRFSPEACLERLYNQVERISSYFAGTTDDTGTYQLNIDKNRFVLWRTASVKEYFRPLFYGSIEHNGDQTKIIGYFDIHSDTKEMTVTWIAASFAICGIGFIAGVFSGSINWGFVIGSASFGLLGVLGAKFWINDAEGQKSQIIHLVENTFVAKIMK